MYFFENYSKPLIVVSLIKEMMKDLYEFRDFRIDVWCYSKNLNNGFVLTFSDIKLGGVCSITVTENYNYQSYIRILIRHYFDGISRDENGKWNRTDKYKIYIESDQLQRAAQYVIDSFKTFLTKHNEDKKNA